MNHQDILIDGYKRISPFLSMVLDGIPQDKLDWRPHPEANPIGWLVWHLLRQHDGQVAALTGEEQVWISGGFPERFNRPSNPMDSGFGWTPEQVAAFKSPETSVFLEYADAVTIQTISFIKTLTEEDLDRELDEPQYTPLPTVGVRLVSILEDCQFHAGQAAYIRGLIEGYGWQNY
jgi:hypothetical protein